MSCFTVKPLTVYGESKVEEDNVTKKSTTTTVILEDTNTERDNKRNTKKVIKRQKRSRRKTNNGREEERIRRWINNTEEWKKIIKQDKLVQAMKKREEERRIKKLSQQKPIGFNEWFGDEMTTSNSWPKKNKNGTIRIYAQNVNGVSYADNYSEWQIILETLNKQQVDVACLTEINLDVKKPIVRYTLTENTKKLDKNSHLIMTGSKTTINNRIAKRGGVLTWTRGNWSGRIIDSGNDSLCRWTYITMAGKNNRKLTIYTLY